MGSVFKLCFRGSQRRFAAAAAPQTRILPWQREQTVCIARCTSLASIDCKTLEHASDHQFAESRVRERANNHNKLNVAQQQDRVWLITLKAQGNRIAKMSQGRALGPEDDNAAANRVGDWTITIAKAYAEGSRN